MFLSHIVKNRKCFLENYNIFMKYFAKEPVERQTVFADFGAALARRTHSC